MDWSNEMLWNKAKLYIGRAHSEERNSALFPFWSTLALEFVARAALARVHPSLLADPGEGAHILYACGINTGKIAKSVAAKTVFSRCQACVEDFTSDDEKFCMYLIGLRNVELHSGKAAFEDIPLRDWLPKFYVSLSKLVLFQERSLVDLLGGPDARAANEMIKDRFDEMEKRVRQLVSFHKDRFFKRNKEDQKKLKADAETGLYSFVQKDGKRFLSKKCPSCSANAFAGGEVIRRSEPYLNDGLIVTELVILPTEFKCRACGLELTSFGELHGAGLGDQIIDNEFSDPVDFFEIDVMEYVDASDFHEPEYGND